MRAHRTGPAPCPETLGAGRQTDEDQQVHDGSPSPTTERTRPLVAHIIDRLDIGGMENGLVNLINHMPKDRIGHAVICLRDATDFRDRINRDDVPVIALGKRLGHDPAIYAQVWRTVRALRPDVVHTRNLPAAEMVVPAALGGVPCRIHGEHGRNRLETRGENVKYNRLRRLLSPWVHQYVAVSRDLEDWLQHRVGIPGRKVVQIYNGVDSHRFHPPGNGRDPLPVNGFATADSIVIGTFGRMDPVKDQTTLARAFSELVSRMPEARARLRLALVGDGALRPQVDQTLEDMGVADQVWLPGFRDDVSDLMRGIDVFVLPSVNEGISNTILEAMACGRPVVATAVGGNPELIADGETGILVPPSDPTAMAEALARYVNEPELIARHGAAGRQRVEREFSLEAMVARYLDIYERLVATRGRVARPAS